MATEVIIVDQENISLEVNVNPVEIIIDNTEVSLDVSTSGMLVINGVASVTGYGVDNSDPGNPVISWPTPTEIGAVDSVTGDYVDNSDPNNPVVDISSLETRFDDLETAVSSQVSITTIDTDDGAAIADTNQDTIEILGAGGATVSASGKTVTVTQKNQILPYENTSAFPEIGDTNIIYIAEDTGFLYAWDGAYAQIGGGGDFVESVTGNGVDNTDPLNPILSWPTPSDIGAVESVSGTYVDNTDPLNPIVDISPLETRVEDIESILSVQSGFTGYAYAVWSGTGLTFNVYWPAYYIQGVRYDEGSGTVTLDVADATNSRLDIIGVDATGAIKVTGTPATDPIKPSIDPLTQLEITVILVAAGATTPTEITNEQIYNENTEWVGASNIPGINFASATSPGSGSVCTNVGSFNNTHFITYTDGVTHDLTDFSVLQYLIFLKAAFSAGGTPTYLKITFYNNATPITSTISVTSGLYNWLRTNTSGYQTVVIPTSAFTIIAGSTFNKIRITFNGSNATGFRLDDIILQTGSATTSPSQPALVTIVTDSGSATATAANDTFNLVGAGGAQVSASGKTITVTQKNQVLSYTNLAAFPVTGIANIVYIAEDTDFLYYWSGASYTQVGGGGGGVESYTDLASFPVTGEDGILYISEDTAFTYYWNGATYVQVGGGGDFVESVTGDGVDNTDPFNPVISYPTPGDIGAELAGAAATAETNAKAYADGLVVNLWDDRGNFDASGGSYPTSGGSGPLEAILKGDTWTISVAGTLPTGQVVEIGDVIRALIDTPGNTQTNWAIQQNNIGYTAENSANKTSTIAGNEASTTLYPSVKGVVDWIKQGNGISELIGGSFDGMGSVLLVNTKTAPFRNQSSGNITGYYICTTGTGTITFDIWKIATGTAAPTVANTIVAAAPPTISTGNAVKVTSLPGWTTTYQADDIWIIIITGVTGSITQATIKLLV